MSNNIYAEDFNAPYCLIRCLAFHMEIKVSGWSCSSFSHVTDINSTSNGKEKGQVWLSAKNEGEVWQQQEQGLSSC